MLRRLPDRSAGPGESAAASLVIPDRESAFRDPATRARLLTGALSWLLANADRFEPPQEDAICDVAPEHVLPGRARKAFGELGLALRLLYRAPALRMLPPVQALAAYWLATARRRNIFFDARRRVHLVPLMAVALSVLSELETAPADAVAAIQAVLGRGFMDRAERSAWSQLDMKYYFDAIGVRHRFPRDELLFDRCSLVEPPALPYALRLDLYAVTHLVFHFSDFGLRPVPAASRGDLRRIRSYCAAALAMCLAEKDYDLAGEFLAARICLGATADPLNRHAADRLAQAQQPGGFIPDLKWLGRTADADADRTPADAATETFFSVYHPTLVAVIVIAAEMARSGVGRPS